MLPPLPRGRPFLTARWLNVLGFTCAIDAERLARHVPAGVEVDELDGAARVSLVAFAFERTRVLGVAVPGHVSFPEINLRFYVRHGGERGVVFVRELVPRRALAWVARALYDEPYVRTPMRVDSRVDAEGLHVEHAFGRGLAQRLRARADPAPTLPVDGGAEHWLTHHSLGLGATRAGQALAYRVEHELWALHAVRSSDVEVDFGAVYGAEWADLTAAQPEHVTLAAGSPVEVFPPSLV